MHAAPAPASGNHPRKRRRSTKVRNKLLTLVLLPQLIALPLVLTLVAHWGRQAGYQQLFIKVSTDLSVAQNLFERMQDAYLDRLAALADSHRLRLALADADADADAIRALLRQASDAGGFSFLRLLYPAQAAGADGSQAGSMPDLATPLLARGWRGTRGVGIEVHPLAQLEPLTDIWLGTPPGRLALDLLPTERAAPSGRQREDRAMLIRVVQPLLDAQQRVLALLDGGVVLNGDFGVVDGIRDLLYGPGRLPDRSLGTVTLFLDDVRISTNVPLAPGERALGTRVSQAVRDQVLGRGQPWIDRAFVVNDWYISGYLPIEDLAGNRIGMLYAGYLEAPFRSMLFNAFVALSGVLLGIALLSTLLGIHGARSIFRPIERISAVIQATRAGCEQRVGAVDARDEIGDLAREFDAMLDLLAHSNRQIREASELLERKVEERTAELRHRNLELERTVALLRETRHALVEAEKLAALGELSAGMAHEINNPMAVILGNLDVLSAELGAAAAPVRGEIELIAAQVERVRSIIDSLLQFARPTGQSTGLETLDVNRVVRDTLKLVEHLSRQAAVDIHLDLQASTQVRIGRQDLQQILVNLLVNALQALEHRGGGGVVCVVSRDWEEQGVRLQIRDNGPGIPPERLDHVFLPFYSTKPTREGSGLGLFVSRLLAHRYGGSIRVWSRPGEGTEFRLWLLQSPCTETADALLGGRIQDVDGDDGGRGAQP
ncbi:cache domain-containing protein [uncultured Thiohalocapsa sp.]|uniref:sensor histidine kinase n=1 Tax=uncultured Thiohalocapsa sp. TaxID=768990 RepID=UPI0025E5074B|nr:cache domain-containing protein [uncultured Thiohalocapsa sp.]